MSLEAKDIISGYGETIVLHGISLVAKPSEITALLGANGSGKSTLLKTIYGFLKPRAGKITLDGEDVTGFKPTSIFKKGVSFVFQERSTFPFMTVDENLQLGGLHLKKNLVKERIEEMYKLFPILEERRNVQASRLSGGEQRMLEIARALISRPKILILDEPSTGLAPIVLRQVFEKIREINRQLGVTVILTEQNVRMALEYSHYAYIIDQGKNRTEGPAQSLLKDKDLVKYILGLE